MCRAGTMAMPEGAFSKMEAMEVTAGDGGSNSEWIKLLENQFVLCWRVSITVVACPDGECMGL